VKVAFGAWFPGPLAVAPLLFPLPAKPARRTVRLIGGAEHGHEREQIIRAQLISDERVQAGLEPRHRTTKPCDVAKSGASALQEGDVPGKGMRPAVRAKPAERDDIEARRASDSLQARHRAEGRPRFDRVGDEQERMTR